MEPLTHAGWTFVTERADDVCGLEIAPALQACGNYKIFDLQMHLLCTFCNRDSGKK